MKSVIPSSTPVFSRLAAVTLILFMIAACNPPKQTPQVAPFLTLTPQATPSPMPTDTPIPPTATLLPPTDTPVPEALAPLPSPQITDLHMVDASNGWALSETHVLYTTDGGTIWLDATPPGLAPVGYSPTSYFMDESHAWIVIPSTDYLTGTLYRTADGGLTWSSYAVPFSGGSMQFLDALNGWMLATLGAGAGSEAVALYRTSDGGAAWNQVYINDPTIPGASDTLPLSGMKSGMTFLDNNHGWVTGSVPVDGFIYLYTTSDGGATWSEQTVAMPIGFETAQTMADAPVFFTPTDGVFHVSLSTAVTATAFYVTHDGGLTWEPTFPINVSGQYSILAGNIWLWDGGPAMYVSTDSGITWERFDTSIDIHTMLAGFQFVDALDGWAWTGDAEGRHALYKTTDGGATWMPLIP